MLDPSILSISAALRKMALIIILFVLVGAAVDIRYMLKAGIAAVLMILTALAFQTIGVLLWCHWDGCHLSEIAGERE